MASLRSFSEHDVDVHLLALTHDGDGDRLTDSLSGLQQDVDVPNVSHRLPIDAGDDVAAHRYAEVPQTDEPLPTPQAGSIRRTTPNHVGDEKTSLRGDSGADLVQGFRIGRAYRPEIRPQVGVRVPPPRDELGHHALDGAGGDGKSDAGRGPARAVDHAVDPHHAASEIQERTSRVTGVDGGVSLNDLADEGPGRTLDDAAQRAHHARGQRAVEAEGIANRHHEPPYLQILGFTKGYDVKAVGAGIHFEDGKIVGWIGPGNLGRHHCAVRKRHVELVCPLDDVEVGNDVSLLVVDETRSGAFLRYGVHEEVVGDGAPGNVDHARPGAFEDSNHLGFQGFDLGRGGRLVHGGHRQRGWADAGGLRRTSLWSVSPRLLP